MKDYLKHAMQIEALIYEQQLAVSNIKNTISNLNNYNYRQKIRKQSFFYETDLSHVFSMLLGGAALGAIIGSLICAFNPPNLGSFWTTSQLMRAIRKAMPRYATYGALIGLIPTVLVLCADYIRISRHNKQAHSENVFIEKNNKVLYAVNQAKIQKLEKELNIAKQNLEKTQHLRDQFYSKNIIHRKYQKNFVAICSFYEYFDTGRCNTLTGHEGAYNLFENEIRLNIIIAKLDEVIQNLNEIKNTQYELYHSINDCNRNISNLNGHLKSIAASSQQTAECSALTSYNTRIAARNTEEMKWLMYYK